MMMKIGIIFCFSTFCFISCNIKKVEYHPFSNNSKIKYVYSVNAITGKRYGKFVWLSYQGDTVQVSYFKNGKINGESLSYFENGKPQTILTYKEDKLNGPALEFYKNGHLASKVIYDNNRLWEILEVYDSTGKALDFGNIIKGCGMARKFYADGRLQEEGSYEGGMKEGYWKLYSNTGVMLDSVLYHEGYLPDFNVQTILY